MTSKTTAPVWGMTILLAAITSIQPLSTDLYLPSMLSIAAFYETDMAHVQFTLTAFMVGFIVGQIIYGPFTDKYGRKPIMLISLGVYIFGTLICLFAGNIETLVLGRFFQAVGGSGPVIISRAVVRDRHKGAAAGRMLASMGFIMGFVPLIAPVIGGFIETYLGWQAHFYVFLGFGSMLILLVIFFLPETINQKTTAKLTPRGFVKIYDGLFASKVFRFFSARIGFGFGGLFAFITGSSYYMQTRFELTPKQFGFAFASVVVGFMLGALLGGRLTGRVGVYKTIFFGTSLQIVGGISMFLLHNAGVFHVAQIAFPMFLYLLGNGIIMPQSQAGSMAEFPHKAGAASSLSGVVQVSFGAVTGALVGTLIEDYIIILPLVIMLISIANFYPSFRHRNDHLPEES
uniref:Bcr/CflA family efflux transporter n=1 Tax=OCS116 cluster bacterium TaxID=2030921 RepID=A0A2A4Z507_9PROT